MIYWALEPDPIFTEIVQYALDEFRDMLKTYKIDPDMWARDYPELARMFPLPQCLREIKALLDAHKSPKVLEPTGYHWLLLYIALEHFCECYNDLEGEGEGDACLMIVHEGTRIEQIDFEEMLGIFFHDLDFAMELGTLISSDVKDRMGITDSASYAAAGLAPHPSELVFQEVKELRWTTREDEKGGIWRKGSKIYPDPIEM